MAPKKKAKRKKRNYYLESRTSTKTITQRGTLLLFFCVVAIILLLGIYKGLTYAGSLFFSRNDYFDLKTLRISSDGRLSSSQLREYAGVQYGVNLFEIDMGALRTQLENISLIESVSIQRDLPDTLVIQVTERTAIAQIRPKSAKIPFLVDRHGVVLPATRRAQALPLIKGLPLDSLRLGDQISDPSVNQCLNILTAVDELNLGSQVRFNSFDLRYPEFIKTTVNEKTSAQFPYHSAREKLIRLVSSLQLANERGHCIKTIDLTPSGRNVPVTYY